MDDETWDITGEKIGVQRGSKSWSIEIFIPFSAFKNVVTPRPGRRVVWSGQIDRHRVGDANDPKGKTDEDSRLNFRFHTSGQGHYHHESDQRDLIDFTRIVFLPKD